MEAFSVLIKFKMALPWKPRNQNKGMGWCRYCFAMAILVIIIKSPNEVLGTSCFLVRPSFGHCIVRPSCFLLRFLLLLSPQTKFRDLLFLHRSLLNFTGRWNPISRGAFRSWNFQNGHRCHGNREHMSKSLTSLILNFQKWNCKLRVQWRANNKLVRDSSAV